MKTTIGILVTAVVMLTGAVGVVIYQKSTYDGLLQVSAQSISVAQAELAAKEAELTVTQQALAEANAKIAITPTVIPIIITGENGLYVEDQSVGNSVSTRVAVMAAPGYVVIHNAVNGQPAAVIGVSALLPAGRSDNVVISLAESTTANSTYIAMLHADEGSGIYSTLIEDKPVLDEDGLPIMVQFRTSASAQAQTLN